MYESIKSINKSTSNSTNFFNRWLLGKIFKGCGKPPVRLLLWDGTEVSNANETPIATLHIHNRTTLLKLSFNPELYFGESYMNGGLDIEGSISEFLISVFLNMRKKDPSPYSALRRHWYYLMKRRRANSLSGSRKNIHFHYDIGNAFYELWLDKEKQYSGAYFPTPDISLEEAQMAKMEHVCRKLWLQPGDRVLDMGSGWGSLARYMVLNHGVYVQAINISEEQIRFSQERAKAEGWDDRVEFIHDDYRNIPGLKQKYDAFVSVGVVEHVDPNRYRELGKIINGSLNNTGRGLLQIIGRNRFTPMQPWMEKYIFPGAHPPSLKEIMDIFEEQNFSVLDVENLRLNYEKTLQHWLDRFEKNMEEIEKMFDMPFIRAWRMYISSAISGFYTGQLQLFQVVFSRPANNRIPLTRAHLYTDDAPRLVQ